MAIPGDLASTRAYPNYPIDPNTGKPLIKAGIIPAGGGGSTQGASGWGQVSVPWFSPEENRRMAEYGAGASASGQFTAPSVNIDFDDPFFSPMPGATKSTSQVMGEIWKPGMTKQEAYQQARAQTRAPDVSFQQGAWHYGLSPDMQQQLLGMAPGLNPLTGRPEVNAALPANAMNAGDWQNRQPYQTRPLDPSQPSGLGPLETRQPFPGLSRAQWPVPATPPPLGGPSALPRMAAPTTTRDLTAAYNWAPPGDGLNKPFQPPPTQPGGAPPPVFVPPPPPTTQPQPVTAGPAPTQAPPPGK